MTVHRTEIELALEVMVRNQRGIDFQHLATQLATQTYPSLVPTEWFHDGGEDAITAPIIGDDRVKRSLACSLTGTWDKVSKDCERIASRGVTIDLLIFFTAVAVTNIQIENWRKQVREKYKHDLDVVGKVRIVSSLERPENAWLCRDYLGLTSADEPDLETLRQRVRKVAVATLSNWKADYGFDPQRQIELTLTLKEPAQDQRRFLTLQSCCDNIRRARKVILTGVPGAGKTVTLLQIAEKLLEESETPIPLVVSLAEWADSNLALLNFLAQRPSCQAVGLSESDLSRLVTAGRLIFLLNGWNEVSDVATEHAFRSLRGLIADCPATAFVIATRETAVTPPLTNPANIHIERLETHQRRAIIHKADLSGPATLIQTIEHQPALEEITRIPLFLSGVIKLARQGKNIPGSKYGILRELVDSTESHPDHKAALFGGPCKGQHKSYLVQIAASMCSNGTTTVGSQELLSSIGACSKNLLGEGLIGSMPDARSVVASLISHHLLVSLDGPTQGSIRFAHQQFQEWFAGEWLYLRFVGIFNAHDQNAVLDFQKQILNNPFWEEPLKFLAERLNPSSGFESRSDYADHLIRWLIPVDLIFAAQLARLVGWRTLTKGRNELAAAARSLYARTEPVSKQFGLVVMLATGSPDFLDIFEPLIENENDQIRLAFYSALEPFPLSCLGDDWHVKLSRWSVSRRAEFVREMMGSADTTHYELAIKVAKADPSPEVRIAALQMLAWNGASEDVVEILDNNNFAEWPQHIYHDVIDLVSRRHISRIALRIKTALYRLTGSDARIIALEILDDLNDPSAEELLRAEIQREGSDGVLKSLLSRIHERNPAWVANWLGNKMVSGEHWNEALAVYLDKATPELLDRLGEVARDESLELNSLHARLRVLSESNPDLTAKLLLPEYIEKHAKYLQSSVRKDGWNREDVILNALRDLPRGSVIRAGRSIEGMLMDSYMVEAILGILSPSTPSGEDLRSVITPEECDWLRNIIFKWDENVVPLERDCGQRRAHLAILLGAVGKPEDVKVLEQWVADDSERFKKETHRISWTNYYAGALSRLNCDEAGEVLLRLLEDPQYIGDASRGLVQSLGGQEEASHSFVFGGPNFKAIPEKRKQQAAWKKRNPSDPRKARYVEAIQKALTSQLAKLKKEGKTISSIWGMREGPVSLAHLGDEECIPILLECTNPDALTVLVAKGVILPGNVTLTIVDPIISKTESAPWHEFENIWYLAVRCFALLLFSDHPQLGVERIRRLPSRILNSYHFRDLVRVLGWSQTREAGEYLEGLAESYDLLKFCPDEYIAALAECHQPSSRNALIRILDTIGQMRKVDSNMYQRVVWTLGTALAQASKEDEVIWLAIRNRCALDVQNEARRILLDTLEKIGTPDAALVACSLARDQGGCSWEYGPNAIRNALIEKVSAGTEGAYYERPKAFNGLRQLLMELVLHDDLRKRSSLMLLIWIEIERIGLGKPTDEFRHPDIDVMKEINIPWPLLN